MSILTLTGYPGALMEKILFCCQKILGKFDLGVTSEKKTDDLKTFVKLVLTPLPPPNFGHFYFGQI